MTALAVTLAAVQTRAVDVNPLVALVHPVDVNQPAVVDVLLIQAAAVNQHVALLLAADANPLVAQHQAVAAKSLAASHVANH